MDIAVVGDRFLVNVFRLIGIEALETDDDKSAIAKIEEIAERQDPKIVLVAERVALKLKGLREKLLKERRFYPIFVVVPDFEGSLGERNRELRDFVNRSMGVKLKVGG